MIRSNVARDTKICGFVYDTWTWLWFVYERVESVNISIVPANDLILLDEDGVQFVLE